MKKLILLVILFLVFLLPINVFAAASCTPKKFVVLGSSTAAGYGASTPSKAWVALYTTYLKSLNSNNSLTNLAVPAYTTYQVLPTGSTPPSGRPSPDPAHNITAAIATKPDVIIVNLPTNDTADGYSATETQSNFKTIRAAAQAASIPIWFSTSQPRNLGITGRNALIALRDWINNNLAPYNLDFWSVVANSDGSINPTYDSGDGIHLNDLGHQILYTRVVNAGIITKLCALTSPTPTVTPVATPSAPTSDINGDGKVDGIDYVMMVNNIGETSQQAFQKTGKNIDLNSDGKIDSLDLDILITNLH